MWKVISDSTILLNLRWENILYIGQRYSVFAPCFAFSVNDIYLFFHADVFLQLSFNIATTLALSFSPWHNIF